MTSIVSDITAIFALASRLRKRFKNGPSQYRKVCNTLDELIRIVKEVDCLVAPSDPDESNIRHGPFDPKQGPRITELSGPDDGLKVKPSDGQNDSDSKLADLDLDLDGSLLRAMQQHILSCKGILIRFEQRAKTWESAIAASITAPKEGSAFSAFTALVGQTRKSIAANISFSEKEMQKCITQLRDHIDALSTYLEIGMVQGQKQQNKLIKNIEHTTLRTVEVQYQMQRTQIEMFAVVKKVHEAVRGAKLIDVGSSYGPGGVVRVTGTAGKLSFLPLTFCQTEEDLSYLLDAGLRGSELSPFFKIDPNERIQLWKPERNENFNPIPVGQSSSAILRDIPSQPVPIVGLKSQTQSHSQIVQPGDRVAVGQVLFVYPEVSDPELNSRWKSVDGLVYGDYNYLLRLGIISSESLFVLLYCIPIPRDGPTVQGKKTLRLQRLYLGVFINVPLHSFTSHRQLMDWLLDSDNLNRNRVRPAGSFVSHSATKKENYFMNKLRSAYNYMTSTIRCPFQAGNIVAISGIRSCSTIVEDDTVVLMEYRYNGIYNYGYYNIGLKSWVTPELQGNS